MQLSQLRITQARLQSGDPRGQRTQNPGKDLPAYCWRRLKGGEDAGADESTEDNHEHSEQATPTAEPDCGATVSDVLNAQPVNPLGQENLRADLALTGAHSSRFALLMC